MAASINPNSLGERTPLPTSHLEAFVVSSFIQNSWLRHCVPLITFPISRMSQPRMLWRRPTR